MGAIGKTIKWVVVLGVIGGAWPYAYRWAPKLYVRWSGQNQTKARVDLVQYAAVKRQDLPIIIPEDGKLRAIKYHPIFSQLRQQGRISFLVPEGAAVKKGDRLVEFEKRTMEDNLSTKQGDLETAKRQVGILKDALEIQIATSKAAVASAQTKLGDAQVALRVYQNLEGPKKLNDLETAINDARTKYNTTLKQVGEVQKRIDEQMSQDEDTRKSLDREMTAAKDAATAGLKAVDTAVLQQKTFRRYDYPQSLATKKDALENGKLEVHKAEVAASREVHQKEEELAKQQDSIKILERVTKDLAEDIARCVLTAPADGMVLYGDPNQRYYSSSDNRIRVGMDWYGGNTIMTIPDLSGFEVTLNIAEQYRGKITEACPATVTLEAVPGLVLKGQIKTISKHAQPRSPWDESSPKVFEAIVSIDKCDPRMVSGMTSKVEILAETVPNALVVPLEAVMNDQGNPVCLVHRPDGLGQEKRSVKPGKSNDHLVEILHGLAEGEQVDLFPGREGN